jgi:hypothetical protein
MAKVRITSALIGDSFSARAGEVIDLPDDEAKRLVAGGVGQLLPDEEATSNNKKKTEK